MESSGGSSDTEALEMQAPPPKRPHLALSKEVYTVDRLPDHGSFTTSIQVPKMLFRRYQPELVQYINLNSLVPYLNEQELLTHNEIEILMNATVPPNMRVLKLLHFIEGKGNRGFQLFLKALSEEQEHLGHRELTELFAPYRQPVEKATSVNPSRTAEIAVSRWPLRRHQPKLMQCINLDSLLPFLNQQQLLTDNENYILSNQSITQHDRVSYLLHYLETKGEDGLLRFFEAISAEHSHLGHKELEKLFAPHRSELSQRLKLQPPVKSIANEEVLQAALQPISGAEFDLHENCMLGQPSTNVEGSHGSFICNTLEMQLCGQSVPSTVTTTAIRSVYEEQVLSETRGDEITEIQREQSQSIPEDYPSASSQKFKDQNCEAELDEVKGFLQNDISEEPATKIVRKYPNLIFPAGTLKKKSNSLIYTTLFKMAWGGKDETAQSVMTYLRRNREVPVDIKIVSMEVVHTVNADRDLKVLTSALAYTDRTSCENKVILKCRLHRRIAGLHYRNKDIEEADEHMDTALQLAHNIAPDIDTIYTYRLKALMLFEDYKITKSKASYKDANTFFTKAMDHARQQPESKRVITERVKISKALFHLDMRDEYVKDKKEEDLLEELEFRAQDTLDDVDEDYLTDGDRAFFYMTRAKQLVCCQNWQAAQTEAQKAMDLNHKCGLTERAKQAEDLLNSICASGSSSS